MEASPQSVFAYIHPTTREHEDSTLRYTVDNSTLPPAIVPEYSGRRMIPFRDRYPFTYCTRISGNELDTSNYENEADELVRLALSGYNAAAVFMSVEPMTAYTQRLNTMKYILDQLQANVEQKNQERSNQQQSSIMMDYAYVGITDRGCHNMRTDRPIDKSLIMEHNVDVCMHPVKQLSSVWSLVKRGSKAPFILKIRLSSSKGFLGHLLLIDLLQPSLYQSFPKLKEMVNTLSSTSGTSKVSTDTFVLPKVMTSYFCGLTKSLFFLHLEEFPRPRYQEDTLETLNLVYALSTIRFRSTRNIVDYRVEMFKSRCIMSMTETEREVTIRLQLEKELEAARQEQVAQQAKLAQCVLNEKKLQEELSDAERKHNKDETSSRLEICEAKRKHATTEMTVLKLKDEIREQKVQSIRDQVENEALRISIQNLESSVTAKDAKITELQKTCQDLRTLGLKLKEGFKEANDHAAQAEAKLSRLTKSESDANKMTEDLRGDLVDALRQYTRLEKARQQWLMEKDALRQHIASLEAQSHGVQPLNQTVHHLQSQVDAFRARAERAEANWQESSAWNDRLTNQSEEERNRLRRSVQHLREQASLSLGDITNGHAEGSQSNLPRRLKDHGQKQPQSAKQGDPVDPTPKRRRGRPPKNTTDSDMAVVIPTRADMSPELVPERESDPAASQPGPEHPISDADATQDTVPEPSSSRNATGLSSSAPTQVPIVPSSGTDDESSSTRPARRKRKLNWRKKTALDEVALSPVLEGIPDELLE